MQSSAVRIIICALLVIPVLAGLGKTPVVRAASPPVTFTQDTDISIANSTSPSLAVPYGIPISVPSVGGPVVKATVTVRGLTHSAAFDLDILVTSPAGRAVLLMSDVGGVSNLNNQTFTFDDAAPDSMPTSNTAITGTRYKPTNSGTGDVMPLPAPPPPGAGYGTQLSTFNNQNPAGDWKLWIVDDFQTAFTGSLSNGWSLTLSFDTPKGVQSITRAVITKAKIQNVAAGNPYPSLLEVSGLVGSVHALQVGLNDLTHAAPADLDIMLFGPQGQRLVLMSDAGGGTDITNVDLRFTDTALAELPSSTALTSGPFRPTNLNDSTTDAFQHPAPTEPFVTTLSAYRGGNPNGTWRLFVTDDRGAVDPGVLGGWSLTIEVNSAPVIGQMPDMDLNLGTHYLSFIPASDVDGDTLAFGPSTIPEYAELFISSSGFPEISLRPDADDVGSVFNAEIVMTDGSLSASTHFQIAVFDDQVAPVITVTVDPLPNAAGWNNEPVTVTIDADDGTDGSGVSAIQLRGFGAETFEEFVQGENTLSHRITAEGFTRIFYSASDRVSNETSGSFDINVDDSAPDVTTPLQRLPSGGRLGTSTVPVLVSWTGQDNLSGLQRFEMVEVLDDIDVGTDVPLPNPLATRITRQLAPGHVYRHCVTAFDNADIETEKPPCAVPARLTRVQEAFASVAYSSNAWATERNTQFSGGAARISSVAGETATFTFTGTSVAWVSTVGGGRGIAEVTLDGGTPVLVDLFSSKPATRQIVFARNGLTDGQHTLTVRVTGDRNPASVGRRVDIDAFVTLREIPRE